MGRDGLNLNRIDPAFNADRNYRTDCKNCQRVITTSQKAIWQTGPRIGLVHERCPDE